MGFYIFKTVPPFNLSRVQEIANLYKLEKGDFDRLNEIIDLELSKGDLGLLLSPNFYLFMFCIICGTFFLFISIHLSIDKLFFKKFFEPPSYLNAIRRSFWILLTIIFGVYFKLIKVPLETILFLPLLAILLEILLGDSINKVVEKTLLKIKFALEQTNRIKKEKNFSTRKEL